MGEIDLIVSKKKELIFIVAKTSLYGKEVPISYFQYQSIINSSKYFLSKNLGFLDYSVRYGLCFLSLRRRPIYTKMLGFNNGSLNNLDLLEWVI
ncbi:hypothetical protein wTpre_602 [Wolbachia endosymbiont of Trichogramma pretiosum]|nr:hypothetical protein wTpre_602 [Wolbachia endosymbiont of Trichogramma pretiosum]